MSPFCLGMVASDETANVAFDAGINFFFLSADLHWPLYESARRGLAELLGRSRNIREQVVVTVVSYPSQPTFSTVALAEVVAAVPGLETIAVAVVGGAYSGEFRKRVEIYREIRESGYLGIKAIGATFHERNAALQAINSDLVDIAFIRYNPSHIGARSDLFPHLKLTTSTLLYNFKSTFSYISPPRIAELGLDDDYWRPHWTDYYRFALTRPEIDGLLCSPCCPEQVLALSRAMEEGPLADDEEDFLIDLATLNEGRAVLESEIRE